MERLGSNIAVRPLNMAATKSRGTHEAGKKHY